MSRDRAESAMKYQGIVVESINSPHTFALRMSGRDRKVLELGCAAGRVTRALAKRGHTVFAVEVDPVAAEHAREHAELVVAGDLDQTPLTTMISEREFDVILMGDVLEHLRDPLTVVREAETMLGPAGFMIISIPNVAHADVRTALALGCWEYQSKGILDDTHLRFFTRASLWRFAQQLDMCITEFARELMPAGRSNLHTDDDHPLNNVPDAVLLDPNSEIYVFVVKLERHTNDGATQKAQILLSEIEQSEALARQAALDVEAAKDRLIEALLRDRDELVALKRTKSMRMLSIPRKVYAKTRRR